MKTARKKAMKIKRYRPDKDESLDRLPNKALILILSKLPIDEAARCSIISKRWRFLWKHASRLDFDVERMLRPLTRLSIPPNHLSNFIRDLNTGKGLAEYSTLFFSILRAHRAKLTSCRIQHFPDRELETWIQVLFEKAKDHLEDLSVACKPVNVFTKETFPTDVLNSRPSLRSLELTCYFLQNPSIFGETFNNLKTLKLKNMHLGDETIHGILLNTVSLENLTIFSSSGFKKLDICNPNLKFVELNSLMLDCIGVFAPSLEVLLLISITCPAKKMLIIASNLRVFNCCNNPKVPTPDHHVPQMLEVLAEYSGFLCSEMSNNFQNLSSLSVDLDLNKAREALLLSYILKSCDNLQTLRIIIPVDTTGKRRPYIPIDSPAYSPSFSFWEGRMICRCVRHKLKFVYIGGFGGMDFEVDFIKQLITRSLKMNTITIVHDGSNEDALIDLQALPSASTYLTIKLKAAANAM